MKTRWMIVSALCLVTASSTLACTSNREDEGGEGTEDAFTARSGGRIEFYEGRDAQWYFRLVGKNGEKLVKSEGYPDAADMKNGLNALVQATGSRIRVLPSQDGKFYVNVVAWDVSERVIATSETYASRSNANEAKET